VPEPTPCKKAQIVRRACKEMGLLAVWDYSRVSESEYLKVWVDLNDGRWGPTKEIRFSDHVLPDMYKYKGGYEYEEHTFEVAHGPGHREVEGDCYQAIEWLACFFDRPVPAWVPSRQAAETA
jgi:hypothetical protein